MRDPVSAILNNNLTHSLSFAYIILSQHLFVSLKCNHNLPPAMNGGFSEQVVLQRLVSSLNPL